jgi:hypothetical protein
MANTPDSRTDTARAPDSSLVTIVSVAVVAYAASDVVHELMGHFMAARLAGVEVVSISSVALQTGRSSRIVAAAGTIADILAGLIAFALLARTARFDAGRYFLWLFGSVSLMNSGYLIFSALLDSGDWAAVVAGLNPPWAWRLGIATAGVIVYAIAMRLAARKAGEWVAAGAVSAADFRRFIVSSYVAGGMLLVGASTLNPIGFRLVAVSGVGASFGLTAGLLVIPRMVPSSSVGSAARNRLTLQPYWVAVAFLVAIAFVGVLGPGIRLSR